MVRSSSGFLPLCSVVLASLAFKRGCRCGLLLNLRLLFERLDFGALVAYISPLRRNTPTAPNHVCVSGSVFGDNCCVITTYFSSACQAQSLLQDFGTL
jgi:hypothetical protein